MLTLFSRPELHLYELNERPAEETHEDLQERGVCLCVSLSLFSCFLYDPDVSQCVLTVCLLTGCGGL